MSLIRLLSLLSLGLVQGVPASAGELPLSLKGSGAYFVLQVPSAVQSQTRASDLSDLQVLNASGEPMPFAWVDDEPAAETTERRQEIPFFDAPRKASAGDRAGHAGWILDTRKVQGARSRLELVLPAGARGIYSLSIEAGDTLQQWQTVHPAVQVLSLQHRGKRLDQTVIDLEGVQARYLRLRPLPGSPAPALASVRVVSVTRRPGWQPLQWSAPITASGCTTQSCDYPLPRHLPLQRFELQLAEVNTLAQVQLLGQSDRPGLPAATESRPRGVRQKLKALRQKDKPPPSEPPGEWWEPLAESSVYWLQLPEGEIRSPALALPGGLFAQLRVQPAGGVAQLGARPPTLRVGSRPRSLVFLTRGPGPYRLAWDRASPMGPLSLGELMPTRQRGDPLPSDTASVLAAPPSTPAPPAAPAVAVVAAEPESARAFWLWGALVLALMLMAGMAWSLLRPSARSAG